MSRFFGILTLIFLVSIFGFGEYRECRASISEKHNNKTNNALSNFFERSGTRQEMATIRIANRTDYEILCVLKCEGEEVAKKMLPGELLFCQIKNQYNYALPISSKATVAFFAVCQNKVVLFGKELKIKFFGPAPTEIVLIISPGTDGNPLEVGME